MGKVLTLEQMLQIKAVAENHGATLHFHDACGGQSATLTGGGEAARGAVADYLASLDITPTVTPDGDSFSWR